MGYLEQWHSLLQCHARLSESPHDLKEQDDVVWAFFSNCGELKECVKNDPMLPLPVRASVDRFIETQRPLKICADLASGSNQLTRDAPDFSTAGAQRPHHELIFVAGAAEPPRIQYLVAIEGDQLVDAKTVAQEAVRAWRTLFESHGLAA